ncbi:unnamed protein product [Gongylonema pulchrum]|uniref:Uncharacterized protein n=1 Tax=Gongylonema pulchrum TaxID=637853 RepID=A0A3P6NYN4_9BILA|nr:unnamed protein product [Gongylonema pulchrum]
MANLLEEEKMGMMHYASDNKSETASSVTLSLMSLGLQCGWPPSDIPNGAASPSTKNSAETDITVAAAADFSAPDTNNYPYTNADYFPQPIVHPSSPPAPAQVYTQQPSSAFRTNQYSPQQYFVPSAVPPPPPPPLSKPQMARVNSFPSPRITMCYNSGQQRAPYVNTQFVPNLPPAAAAPTQVDSSRLREWQEGFRALLPNVNVRFAPNLTLPGYASSNLTPSMELSHPNQFPSALTYDQAVPIPAQHASPMNISAPMAIPPPLPSANSFSHPAPPPWMMPPPGFSYVSKR